MKFEVKGQEIEQGDLVLIKGNNSSGYLLGVAQRIVKKERRKRYFLPKELRKDVDDEEIVNFEPSEYLTFRGAPYQLTATNFYGKRIAGFEERRPKTKEDESRYSVRTIEQFVVGKENIISFLEGHEDKIYSVHAREIRELSRDRL